MIPISGRSIAQRIEEILHAGKEAGRFRIVVLGGNLLEFLQQLALPLRQLLRRLDLDLDVEIADLGRTKHGHALGLETELLADLRTLGNADARLGAVEGCNIEGTAK